MTLKKIDETLENDYTGLSHTRAKRLNETLDVVKVTFIDLESELMKYDSLDTKSQRKWQALRWGLPKVSEIRFEIIAITSKLNVYLSAITEYATFSSTLNHD